MLILPSPSRSSISMIMGAWSGGGISPGVCAARNGEHMNAVVAVMSPRAVEISFVLVNRCVCSFIISPF